MNLTLSNIIKIMLNCSAIADSKLNSNNSSVTLIISEAINIAKKFMITP